MATTPIEHIESLRVGSVIFVSPSEIKIRLDAEAPDSVALNTGLPVKFPRVNNYLIIPSDCAYVVCQVVWAQLVQVEVGSSFDKSIVGLPRSSRILSLSPLATIIFEFLFCASAQGEDSKEKKGCGGKEEWKENPFVNFGTKAPQALRHGSADCPWSIRCRGYGFLRGRPGFLFGRASRAAFFGSTAGLKSGYFAM